MFQHKILHRKMILCIYISKCFNFIRDDLNDEEEFFHSDAMITYNSPDFDINIQEFDPYTFIKHLPPYNDVIRSGNLSTVLPHRSNSLTTTHTLVLDLDETLVHCSIDAIPNPDLQFPVEFSGQTFNVYVKIRPFLKHFMEQVSRLYEIVIFTASQRVYADKLLDTLDPTHTQIQYYYLFNILYRFRLFRDSCICVNGNYMKDLNVLGRDVNKCIIVDNSPHAFGYQVDNGIPINSWFDDENDNELLKLLPFLIRLSKSDQVQSEIRNRYHLHKFVENSP